MEDPSQNSPLQPTGGLQLSKPIFVAPPRLVCRPNTLAIPVTLLYFMLQYSCHLGVVEGLQQGKLEVHTVEAHNGF